MVSALNKRPLEKIGFLRPDDIHSEFDDIKVQEAQKSHNLKPYSEPDWQTQEKQQKEYENSSKNKFQVGTFVYLDYPQHVFEKSFHVQVSLSFLAHLAFFRSVCYVYLLRLIRTLYFEQLFHPYVMFTYYV